MYKSHPENWMFYYKKIKKDFLTKNRSYLYKILIFLRFLLEKFNFIYFKKHNIIRILMILNILLLKF